VSDKKKAAAKVVDLKDLTERLGPSRKVVKTSKAEGTENSVVLHLECGHKRVATKRATLRCRKCRKGAKPAAAAKKSPVKAVKKSETKKAPVVKAAAKREPVTAPSVEKTIETVASAMSHKRAYKK
jgi:hypothetical protein